LKDIQVISAPETDIKVQKAGLCPDLSGSDSKTGGNLTLKVIQ